MGPAGLIRAAFYAPSPDSPQESLPGLSGMLLNNLTGINVRAWGVGGRGGRLGEGGAAGPGRDRVGESARCGGIRQRACIRLSPSLYTIGASGIATHGLTGVRLDSAIAPASPPPRFAPPQISRVVSAAAGLSGKLTGPADVAAGPHYVRTEGFLLSPTAAATADDGSAITTGDQPLQSVTLRVRDGDGQVGGSPGMYPYLPPTPLAPLPAPCTRHSRHLPPAATDRPRPPHRHARPNACCLPRYTSL